MYELSLRTPSMEDVSGKLPLWLHPEFLNSVAELQQCEVMHLVCHKGEQLVAMMPLYEKNYLGIKRLISPVSAYYQGLWFFWESGREQNRDLLDELKVSGEVAAFLKGRYQRMEFNLAPHNFDVRGFTWAGLKTRPLYTFVHKLSEPCTPLKDERRRLKTAAEQGYQLEEQLRPEQFISMLKELHQRKQQRFPISYQKFAQWMIQLESKGLLTQYNLTRDGEIVSSDLVLHTASDYTAYFIIRCTNTEDLKSGASALHSVLMAENLAGEYDYFDFCGANKPDVARFKAALGFQLKLFFQVYK